MLKVYKNAWKIRSVRKKMMFVLMILAIYRLGSHLPLPGISLATVAMIKEMQSQGNTLYSLIAGGGMASIFALGIGPYITSSIIMQLLTVAITPLEQLKKEGEEGRKKINQYTRVLAVGLAFVQALGMVFSLRDYFTHPEILTYIMATMSMVAGTIFIMWMSELVNEKGIGNGTSFIIFANIMSGLPRGVVMLVNNVLENGIVGYITTGLLLVVFVIIIMFVVRIQGGERQIPIKYSKRDGSRKSFVSDKQYMPMKVNIAGVMSIIFAVSILQFPMVLNQLLNNSTITRVSEILDMNKPTGALIYVVLIFFFTFFYTSFAINPVEMAENMKKNASFIPGVRPGKPTIEYFDRTINRLSWIGASFYSVIAITPILLQWIFRIPVGFGGTTLLIVTGVCLELVKQMEAQLLNRHYGGFLD